MGPCSGQCCIFVGIPLRCIWLSHTEQRQNIHSSSSKPMYDMRLSAMMLKLPSSNVTNVPSALRSRFQQQTAATRGRPCGVRGTFDPCDVPIVDALLNDVESVWSMKLLAEGSCGSPHTRHGPTSVSRDATVFVAHFLWTPCPQGQMQYGALGRFDNIVVRVGDPEMPSTRSNVSPHMLQVFVIMEQWFRRVFARTRTTCAHESYMPATFQNKRLVIYIYIYLYIYEDMRIQGWTRFRKNLSATLCGY